MPNHPHLTTGPPSNRSPESSAFPFIIERNARSLESLDVGGQAAQRACTGARPTGSRQGWRAVQLSVSRAQSVPQPEPPPAHPSRRRDERCLPRLPRSSNMDTRLLQLLHVLSQEQWWVEPEQQRRHRNTYIHNGTMEIILPAPILN